LGREERRGDMSESDLDDVLADLENTSRELAQNSYKSHYQAPNPGHDYSSSYSIGDDDEPIIQSAEYVEAAQVPSYSYNDDLDFGDVYTNKPQATPVGYVPPSQYKPSGGGGGGGGSGGGAISMGFLPPVTTGKTNYSAPASNSNSFGQSVQQQQQQNRSESENDNAIDDDLRSMMGGFKKNIEKNSNSAAATPAKAPLANYSSQPFASATYSPTPQNNNSTGFSNAGSAGSTTAGGGSGGANVCGKCNQKIGSGKYMTALGRSWHNSCFRCLYCNDDLVQWGKFFPSQNKQFPLCERCYRKACGQ